jgi:hypothetical protein
LRNGAREKIEMHTHTVTFLSRNRLLVEYADGVKVYYDARHQVIKIPAEDGGFKELVLERGSDGSFRPQLLVTRSSKGQVSIQNY